LNTASEFHFIFLLGKLTFEEFVNAYLLINQNQAASKVSHRDRLNYVLDHNNPTPGKKKFHHFPYFSIHGFYQVT
jgi:hypothetical protein